MNRKQGFTLIELLVVMALLAILLVAGVGAFTSSIVKSRDNTRKANLRAITNALELYYNDKGKYPLSDPAGTGAIKGCGTDTVRTLCAVNGPFQDSTPATPTMYMAQLPTDPIGSLKYYYVSGGTPNGAQYQIYAYLENSQDSAINPTIVAKQINCNNAGGTTFCNWGLSSANTNP
jgi:prepilin-type N-terminal cleavage/methylation domain-containing protein